MIKTIKKLFRKKQIIKKISLLEEELIESRKTLYHIYDGIEILFNNMGEINEERFDSEFSYMERRVRMKLFRDWDDKWYFERVLKGIGISKTTIDAYLHGFLNTYYFERRESELVSQLNDYNNKLKILTEEPFEYICSKCGEIIKINEKEIKNMIVKGIIACPLCHSEMYRKLLYDRFYERDSFTNKLINQKRLNILDLLIYWLKEMDNSA